MITDGASCMLQGRWSSRREEPAERWSNSLPGDILAQCAGAPSGPGLTVPGGARFAGPGSKALQPIFRDPELRFVGARAPLARTA
jgi:hypothetical protein